MKRRRKELKRVSDLDILEALIKDFAGQRKKEISWVSVSDVLKAMQLKLKLAPQGEAEKIFWDLIDQLRAEEIGTPEHQRGR